jgi:hypothetical protein
MLFGGLVWYHVNLKLEVVFVFLPEWIHRHLVWRLTSSKNGNQEFTTPNLNNPTWTPQIDLYANLTTPTWKPNLKTAQLQTPSPTPNSTLTPGTAPSLPSTTFQRQHPIHPRIHHLKLPLSPYPPLQHQHSTCHITFLLRREELDHATSIKMFSFINCYWALVV